MELLPCPFCGSNNLTDIGSNVICVNCGSCSSIWNTRHSPWVSVKDRLPNEHQIVILNEIGFLGDFPWISIFCNKEFRNIERVNEIFQNVTHWMPLPSLPEENL